MASPAAIGQIREAPWATATTSQPLDVSRGIVHDADPTAPVTSACNGRMTQINDGVRFAEGDLETGCGRVRVPVTVVPGATDLTVLFVADRVVTDGQIADLLGPIPDFIQELRLLYRGDEVERRAIFPEHQLVIEPEEVRFDFALPDTEDIELEWYFLDNSRAIAADIPGQVGDNRAYSAHVTDVSVRIGGLPIDASGHVDRHTIDGDFQVAHWLIEARLPESQSEVGAVVRAPDGARLVRVLQDGAVLGEAHYSAGIGTLEIHPGDRSGAHIQVFFEVATLARPTPALEGLAFGLLGLLAIAPMFAYRAIRALQGLEDRA